MPVWLTFENILIAWGGLLAFAQVIVRITPTQRDDAFIRKVVGFRLGVIAEQLRNVLTLRKPKAISKDTM